MAGVLTGGPAGATTRRDHPGHDHRADRHASVAGTQLAGRVWNGAHPPGRRAAGVGTLLLGLVRFDDPDRSVDLLAAVFLGWLLGWGLGPIAARGAGQGLRPEWFALLPISPRRLAAGLLGASFVGFAPAVTLVAFAALPVASARNAAGHRLEPRDHGRTAAGRGR